MDESRLDHLEIELRRCLDALRAFVAWHEMDHDSTPASDIQAAYDKAIDRAKELVSQVR